MNDQQTLGNRIRAARESMNITQAALGKATNLSRVAISQIELGNRAVSSMELEAIARTLCRDLKSFFQDNHEEEEDSLKVLFRAHRELSRDKQLSNALQNCVEIGHALATLERLLNIDRAHLQAAHYQFASPQTRWQAIEQGATVATAERKRLGLGDHPIGDLMLLLESQGLRSGILPLPDKVSGLKLWNRTMGSFIVINQMHPWLRRRFSIAHEYAHALIDQQSPASVSYQDNRTDLLEIRANSFAAEFLMPKDGVEQYVHRLGKGCPTRAQFAVYDEHEALCIDQRLAPGSQAIKIHDLVLLAHHFCVSRPAMLYRLKNLRLITQPQLESLQQLEQTGVGRQMAAFLSTDETSKQKHDNDSPVEFRSRFLSLALEAYRREAITESKLLELTKLVGSDGIRVKKILSIADLDTESDK